MKAAVVHQFDQPLTVEERELAAPGPHQVVVRIEASGLCHTDIHAARGDWPVQPAPPFVPGHEGIGIVEEVGSQATAVSVGDRVAIPWLGSACGHCDDCLRGWETLCLSQQNTGYGVDGGYAERALADSRYVVKVPEGVSPLEAAPLACAGVTTYKAIKVAGVRPTDLVLISGIGGLGHLALQYAKVFGGTVVAVDVTDEKLALAKELGADYVIDARTQDVAATVTALGGADVAIGLAVSTESFTASYDALRRGGRLVLVAMPADGVLPVPVFDLVLGGKSVIGSIVGTRADLEEVYELHARGRTRVIYETRTLEQVNDAFEQILSGDVPARLVFDMSR
jgi:propanol-preferring alcohol dehydrogenase